jgi:hypothetical protein
MDTRQKAAAPDPAGLGRIVYDDVKRGKLVQTFRRDVRDIYRFYLTDDERERLAKMKRVRRLLWIAWWLSRNLLLRLSPNRRLLLVLAAAVYIVNPSFTWKNVNVDLDFSHVSFPLAMVVLALELKDKLLARDEIEVARQVQLSLLPTTHPTIEGWEVWSATTPANDVGGDLIDYLDGAGGRLGVALGDVAGKGMGAALLCAKLQATLRALAPSAADLEQLGLALNGILERSGLDNRYATLFYCEIAARASDVRYLNAGHNPALVVRADAIDALPASSLPLGMLPGTTYAQGRVALGPGESLILYSDGITEATNAAGAEYGLARLQLVARENAARSPEELARQVLADVARFLDHEKPHDDQSLLVLRRTGA